MKARIVAVVGLALAVWVGLVASYTYRQVRNERVKTRIALQLSPGLNRLFLALPRGSYVCALGDTPGVRPSGAPLGTAVAKALTTTTILRGEEVIVSNATNQWLKFRVPDDGYSPVTIETFVQPATVETVYLNVGATF